MHHNQSRTLGEALPGFLDYLAADRHFAPATRKKYGENIEWFVREIANPAISEITLHHFISVKARLGERGAKTARMASIICALKSIMAYSRDVLGVPVIDLSKIKIPRSPRREVVYLTKEELEEFLVCIPLRTWMGKPRVAGYRFRAIAETLAATAMRISEALSLDRATVDFARKQAKIVGKGNKERTAFFTDRSLNWIVRYLDLRTDANAALFATTAGSRMTANVAEAMFKRHTKALNFAKPVTPHVIRHTAATNLLQNGCPIGFIKEILGHERLETTCRFYLGILNKADTQKAHQLYSSFDAPRPGDGEFAAPAYPVDVHMPASSPLTNAKPPL
ncbi:MAG: tyrosine-type recombinase/integrase [bacterium]|nr:tyrosine-type recombinase/integrase [bacterium]